MNQKSTVKMFGKSIVCIIAILLFYCLGGAISQTQKMNPADTKFTQGICIWLSVICALAYQKLRKRSFTSLGFRKVTVDGMKNILFCIPCIAVILTGMITGFRSEGTLYVIASMFMTIAVGFSEEIYFRGFIFQIWDKGGYKTAIIVSSILFGLCHSANMIGGRGLGETLLQIVFAFLYGIDFVLMFVLSNSLLPGIIMHFLHDFFNYIGNDGTVTQIAIVIIVQTILLLVYMILMLRIYQRKQKEHNLAFTA